MISFNKFTAACTYIAIFFMGNCLAIHKIAIEGMRGYEKIEIPANLAIFFSSFKNPPPPTMACGHCVWGWVFEI